MKDKIGIYGGTFDPIHFGHLNLAIQLKEKHALKEVWFCPARVSPHKLDKQAAADSRHRLEMVATALVPVPEFKLLYIETQREGPSYTVDTLRFLYEQEIKRALPRQLHLLMGDDQLAAFLKWKEPEQIVQLAPPLIGCRQENCRWEAGEDPISQAILRGMTVTSIMEISSTEIRHRIAKGLYCGHWVPEKVLDYIQKHRLYSKDIY
ncbi:nicotinate-nucleotide adenylyltransferase [Parachlamydia sp. AcF125]|uniref:nicotinate-nucleotide adenylyltransferase n=1 Tax=Parachlamydia sp. AcF125 TaxID=2795736 RepID=UPI001BCA2979|nr:nicotinate-nucleotide adenylyltransferase [Parachlamydia sp. AcF125]MBS4168499.1 Nicotinate-nucleotide adenylyltransferase [Parachlamydia sp. AcF125]